MLGFAPISSLPISAFPYYSNTSGIFATGAIGSVTTTVGKAITVTGVRGTGVIGVVGAGQGATITVTGVRGTGTIDHVCLRTWNEVDTVVC
jgi:hypothetical protein